MRLRPTNVATCGMLLLASIALGIGGHLPVWASIIGVVTLVHMLWGVHLKGKPRLIIMVMLALPMAAVFQDSPRDVVGPIYLLMMLGLYFQSLGIYQLLCARNGGSVENAIGCAVAGIAFAGTISRASYLLPLFIPFVMLLLWQLRIGVGSIAPRVRSLRRVVLYGVALLVAIVVAVGFDRGANAAIPELNSWVARKLFAYARPPSTLGYSRQARLDSMTNLWNTGRNSEIALRVWADQEPGYLRGATFDHYQKGAWYFDSATRMLPPIGSKDGRSIFDASNQPAGDLLATVYPTSEFANAYFVPLNVHRLSAFTGAVYTQPGLTFRPNGNGAMGGYSYYSSREPMAPASDIDLDVPAELQKPLDNILWTIIRPDDEPRARIAKIEQYFHNGFTYRLGIELKTDKDPVIEFLQDIRAGHCEFFAASATLLLRRAGIPSRYVTGMVVKEPGQGGTWLSRRKDAHAWVESYLPDAGWVTVEPTAPDNRPSAPSPTDNERWMEMLQSYWQRIAAVFAHGGVTGVVALAWGGFVAFLVWVPAWLWLIVAIIATGWVFRENLGNMFRHRARDRVSERALALRVVLAEAERLLAQHGQTRDASTPVGHFLESVRHAEVPAETKTRAVELLERYQATRFTK
jgi:transglutaminase-like putative cysteine protease